MSKDNPPAAPSFQDLILALERYWAGRGCVVMQPYDKEMGAGTFHPATFLRAIGPEPWSAAYVQPSRRPTDGRYGDNPFRLQHYYQYQVVIKPSPENLQDLYLDSLVAIGIDPDGPRSAYLRYLSVQLDEFNERGTEAERLARTVTVLRELTAFAEAGESLPLPDRLLTVELTKATRLCRKAGCGAVEN